MRDFCVVAFTRESKVYIAENKKNTNQIKPKPTNETKPNTTNQTKPNPTN